MKINQLCKFILFHLGSWLIFIWEVGSFTTFVPSSVLLTTPHIIEVVREAIRNKIYRNIDAMLQDIANLNKVTQKRPSIHTTERRSIYIISYKDN